VKRVFSESVVQWSGMEWCGLTVDHSLRMTLVLCGRPCGGSRWTLASWRAGAGPGGVRSCKGSQPMEQVINVKPPPPPPARTATLIRASTGAHRQTDRQTDTATMIYVLRSFLLRRAAYMTAVRIAEVHGSRRVRSAGRSHCCRRGAVVSGVRRMIAKLTHVGPG